MIYQCALIYVCFEFDAFLVIQNCCREKNKIIVYFVIFDWCSSSSIESNIIFVIVVACWRLFRWHEDIFNSISFRLKATRHRRQALREPIDIYCERISATKLVKQAPINSRLTKATAENRNFSRKFSRNEIAIFSLSGLTSKQ